MRIIYKGDTEITLSRSGSRVRIKPGLNILPEFEWISSVVSKNKLFEVANNIELTKKGTVKKGSKTPNRKRKSSK